MEQKKINHNYFLGIFPDEKASASVKQVLAQVGQIFDSHNIPINLVHPDTFHITVIYLGKKLPWVNQKLLERRLNKYRLPKIKLSLEKVRLGISRNNREHLFLIVDDGAEELRKLVFDLAPKLGIKREQRFVPHLTLGRVSKDLTDQEFKNLNESIHLLNLSLGKTASFEVDHYKLVDSKNGKYSYLKAFIAN